MINNRLKQKLIALLLPYQPSRVGIFGSYARGEHHEKSDLDILICFKYRISLLKLVQIQHHLSDELEIAIDLVTENALKNSRLKAAIYQDLINIFDEEKGFIIS